MDTEKLVMHIIPASGSYDPNSGYSFDVQIFCLNEDDKIDYMRIALCKPEIYGLKQAFNNEMQRILKKALNTDELYHDIAGTRFLINQNNLFGIMVFSKENEKFEETMFDLEKSMEIKEQLWEHLFTKRLVKPSTFNDSPFSLYEEYGGLDNDSYRSGCNIH